MKKVVAIFVALSILISTLSLTPFFADETKRMQSSNRQVIIVQQKEKKESLFSKISNKFKNLVFKLILTAFYYYLVTIGLVNLFEKLEIFKAEEVYSKFKFGDFLSFIWLNAKSFPGCIKLIYNEIKNLTNNQENSQSQVGEDINNIKRSSLSEKEKTTLENFTCSVIKAMETIYNNKQKSENLKFTDSLKSLNKVEIDIKNLWDYLKTHGTLIWGSSIIGSIIGMLGTMVGAFNFGWIYGTVMVPYLWSFKDKQKGDLEILANGVDFADNLWKKSCERFQKTKDVVIKFFDKTLLQCIIDLINNSKIKK